jgi:hypothetical protein
MCGIFGLISPGGVFSTRRQAQQLLENFYVLSESRGKEASGAALLVGERIDVVKAPIRGRSFLALPEAKKISAAFVDSLEKGRPFAMMGHTRMVTNGGGHIHGNNQPVIRSGLVAIHNGIIVNEREIWRRMPEATRRFEVDTEAVLALLEQQLETCSNFITASARAMRELQGANSIALMSRDYDGLVLATANGSMFIAHDVNSGMTSFASERAILEKIIRNRLHRFTSMKVGCVMQLHPGELVSIALDSPVPVLADVDGRGEAEIVRRKMPRDLTDYPTSHASMARGVQISNIGEIEALTKIDWQAVQSMKRCTRCVLPATFPFIQFDAAGVCNFCNNHRPLALKGEAELRRVLDKDRRSNGAPEVLFPLSGGRDSCFGLHRLVRDFDIKPVAYTYDWGMVTDLARRNISRMCGALGIEHVLISADIKKKRDFIKKNVAAWLRQPHLGTIPLFMAGDKHFFYYANMLKKEMRLASTLFSMNPLERTDFKVGFCGIDESYSKELHYDPKLNNKLRLGAFYAIQFLKNRAYINASLLDSAFAYFSYYLIPKDYISMFDYLPWYEEEVASTLLGQYDWEKAPDTQSTWRIGDGTAAFYNYIYLKTAGFSENDTFRSNQIRAGLVTREEAIAKIYEDNQPRVASIAWYFDTIGLDPVEAVKVINTIPVLYGQACS